METLTTYVEKEKEAEIKQILERANLREDELKKLDLARLNLCMKAYALVQKVLH